jgi:glycerol-3-phosphate O-acyltransferase
MLSPFLQAVKTDLRQAGCPQELLDTFLGFCSSYEAAIVPKEPPLATFRTFMQAVASQLQRPHNFGPYHQAERAPVDYYQLGLDFISPLIDFSHSRVLGKEALINISEALKRKENAILLANHQTEIDPQIISLLLEKEHPRLAEEMIFVAGHRVVTDPLAIPLSLGRNLICIYSKRHIDHPPEKRSEKLQHNQLAMKVLQELLNEGGKCIYIAPSGGRDRKDENGQLQIAPFDPQAVEMFYLLAQRSSQPTHMHTLALKTYELLPPPEGIKVEIGETRKTSFAPCFLSFSAPIDMEQVGNAHEIRDKKERRQVRADALYRQVVSDYSQFEINSL